MSHITPPFSLPSRWFLVNGLLFSFTSTIVFPTCPLVTMSSNNILTRSYSIHRYSMPTSSMHSQFRSSVPGFNSNNSSNNPSNNSGNNNNSSSSTLESFSAAKYLFPSEEENDDRVPTPDVKSYLKLTEPDDKFPTLFRRNESGLVSSQLLSPVHLGLPTY